MWAYNPPVDIDAYNPTKDNATVVVRGVKEAEWNRNLTALESLNGVCARAKYLIIYGVGEYYVVTIKQRCVGYGVTTPKQIMQHVREKTFIKITTLDILQTMLGYRTD